MSHFRRFSKRYFQVLLLKKVSSISHSNHDIYYGPVCIKYMTKDKNVSEWILSRGGLIIPSSNTACFVCSFFAILDFTDTFIEKHTEISTRAAAEFILPSYTLTTIFTCRNQLYFIYLKVRNKGTVFLLFIIL